MAAPPSLIGDRSPCGLWRHEIRAKVASDAPPNALRPCLLDHPQRQPARGGRLGEALRIWQPRPPAVRPSRADDAIHPSMSNLFADRACGWMGQLVQPNQGQSAVRELFSAKHDRTGNLPILRPPYLIKRGRPGSPNGHSNAARSHRPRSAAASYVVCRKSISVRLGSLAVRTAS